MPKIIRTLLAMSLMSLAALSGQPAIADDGCEYRDNEKRTMTEVNDRRDNNGRDRLSWDLALARVARHHTIKMAANGDIFHNLEHNGTHITKWSGLGEVIGRVSHKDTDQQSVMSLVNALMASDAHRSIILDSSWKYLGAGTVKGKDYLWVTVIFERDSNPGTTFHSC